MWNSCLDADPTGQILTAWIAKQELRALLATARDAGHRHDISHRLDRFYDWCANADIPEITWLTQTVEDWWPEIEAVCKTGITNAKAEATTGHQGRRPTSCRFRKPDNQHRRARYFCIRQSHRSTVRPESLPGQA